MKIPDDTNIHYHENSDIIKCWVEAALQISLQHGIYVQLGIDYRTAGNSPVYSNQTFIDRLYFKVLGHEFESLKDLKTAVDNKMFL